MVLSGRVTALMLLVSGAAMVMIGLITPMSVKAQTALSNPSARDIASQVPPSISEVIVGGQWESKDASGAYRAVLVFRVIEAVSVADIVLQWLVFEDDESEIKIVHSETISTVRGEPAETAFVAFDFGKDDTEPTRLLIGSFDPQTQTDRTRFVRLGKPAEFEFVSQPGAKQPAQ